MTQLPPDIKLDILNAADKYCMNYSPDRAFTAHCAYSEGAETYARKWQEAESKITTLSMWLLRLMNSIKVHPEFTSGRNIEFIDYVEGAEEALELLTHNTTTNE